MDQRNYAAELTTASMAAPLPQPTYADRLRGMPTFASLYPTVAAGGTMPSYAELERNPDPPDLAPTQLVKGIVGAVGDRLMQAHEAMPWGGNNPQAIGYDPRAGTIDPSVMVPFAADVAGMATTGSLAAPAMKNATGMGIRAYHGSPHDFDRFSMDKIGTGEGAQAYGHGLYFAENEGVARGYREALTANRGGGGPKMVTSYDVGGRHIPQSSPDWALADVAGTMREHGIDPTTPDGMDWLDNELGARYMSSAIGDTAAARAKVLDFYSANEFKRDTAPGRMYEVDINASPDEFLDWDKPLSEQPAKVREALRPQYEVQPSGDGFEVVARTVAGDRPVVRYRSREVAEDYIKYAQTGDFPASEVQAMVRGGDERGAAEALRAAGIKGIRYKDAGSRGTDAAGGTSNYVVFDDSLIDILKKYGIAGLTAGGAGAAMLGGSTQDASAMPMPSYTTGGRF